eukprot:811546-Pyramimonas_sp.AAC.1
MANVLPMVFGSDSGRQGATATLIRGVEILTHFRTVTAQHSSCWRWNPESMFWNASGFLRSCSP